MARLNAQEKRIAALLNNQSPRPNSDAQLEHAKVFMSGHFRLRGNRHSKRYVNFPLDYFDSIEGHFTLSQFLRQLQESRAFPFRESEVVVGPETGGAVIARKLAELSGNLIPWFALQKSSGSEFGYELNQEVREFIAGKRVVVVDNVIDSGTTLSLIVIPLLVQSRANVIGAAVIADRGGVVFPTPCPLESYWEESPSEYFLSDDCPMCKAGEPITKF